jgi:hypothetical protein
MAMNSVAISTRLTRRRLRSEGEAETEGRQNSAQPSIRHKRIAVSLSSVWADLWYRSRALTVRASGTATASASSPCSPFP